MAQRLLAVERREKWRGHFAMLLFALLIAGSFSFGKRAAPHIDAAALNAMRFFFAVIIMGASAHLILRRQGMRIEPPAAIWRFGVLGALMAVYFISMFMALKFASPVSTGAVFTLVPLMSAGFAFLFMRQRTRFVVIISLLIAAAGAVWVIFRGSLDDLLLFRVGRGEMIFFVGCVAHAAYAPLVTKFNRGEPVAAFTFWTLVATWGCILIVAMPQAASTAWMNLPSVVWLAIAYLTIFTTVGTFFLLQYAVLRIPAGKALAYGYLTPSFIILLEGAVGAGWAGWSTAAGAAMSAAGLVIMILTPDD